MTERLIAPELTRSGLIGLEHPEPELVAEWRSLGMGVARGPDFLQAIQQRTDVRESLGCVATRVIPLRDVFSVGEFVEFDFGGFLFLPQGDGYADFHALVVAGPKQPTAVTCASAAIDAVFLLTDYNRLRFGVDSRNEAMRRLAEGAGFRLDFRSPFCGEEGVPGEIEHYSLELDTWVRRKGPRWVFQQCWVFGQPERGIAAMRRYAVAHQDLALLEEFAPYWVARDQ